jgi:hypothetical protein
MFAAGKVSAQQILPGIRVMNYSDKIIIDWKNEYQLPVSNINIQRSYDSLKNFTTIGTVLNPQNKENGYSDNEPPYNKMYYRVFIAFEGGSYIISPSVRPVKLPPVIISDTLITGDTTITKDQPLLPWQVDPRADTAFQAPPPVKNEIAYPSLRIFTAKDNNVIIHLPDALLKKYEVKFFDHLEKELFQLSSLTDEYLIIEKVNFRHSGWFYFEIYEDGKLIEKNKFFVPKDGKINNGDPVRKAGSR